MIRTFAYLDAGTGSMIIQAVAGAALAGVVFFKSFGRRIFNFISSKKNKKTTKDTSEQ